MTGNFTMRGDEALTPVLHDRLLRFYRFLDSGNVAGMCALMHSQFLWFRQGKELRTHDDIAGIIAARDGKLRVFHLLNSVLLERLSDDRIKYSGYLSTLRAHTPEPGLLNLPPAGFSLHVLEGEFAYDGDDWGIAKMTAGPAHLAADFEGNE